MGTQEIAIQLGGLRRREMRRLFTISAIVHLVLIASFAISPRSKISVPRGVISVELLSAPSFARPAAPAPVAKRAPPKPAPLKPKKVVLPAEPTTPKVKPKIAKPKPVTKPAPPKAEPEKQYEDVLAQLRAETNDDEPAPPIEIAKAGSTAIGPPGSPDGVEISPEVAAWLKKAKIHVKKNWVLTAGFRTQIIEAHVEVNLDASGRVRGKPRVSRRSGNPWYDEGVVRAIEKSSPLPPPPEAGKWNFVFVPEDSY
jgi:TonB family protein